MRLPLLGHYLVVEFPVDVFVTVRLKLVSDLPLLRSSIKAPLFSHSLAVAVQSFLCSPTIHLLLGITIARALFGYKQDLAYGTSWWTVVIWCSRLLSRRCA